MPPRSIRAARHSANLAVTRMAHWIARIGSARQRWDVDAWIPGRGRVIAGRTRSCATLAPAAASTSDWLDGSAGQRIVDLLQGGQVVSVLWFVRWSCGAKISAQAIGAPTPPNCCLCVTCFWVSCLFPSARCKIVILGKFCVPISFQICQPPFVAEPRNVAVELFLNLPKIDLSVTVAVLQLEPAMSRVAARVVLPAELSASEEVSSDEELQGQSNMWCPLLEAAYHSIGGYLAMSTCHSSKAALSQSCHFALFVSPVARSSTKQFFTLCDVHLEHERASQEACLQRSTRCPCGRGRVFRAPHCRRAAASHSRRSFTVTVTVTVTVNVIVNVSCGAWHS